MGKMLINLLVIPIYEVVKHDVYLTLFLLNQIYYRNIFQLSVASCHTNIAIFREKLPKEFSVGTEGQVLQLLHWAMMFSNTVSNL